jgi:hypothetical protein
MRVKTGSCRDRDKELSRHDVDLDSTLEPESGGKFACVELDTIEPVRFANPSADAYSARPVLFVERAMRGGLEFLEGLVGEQFRITFRQCCFQDKVAASEKHWGMMHHVLLERGYRGYCVHFGDPSLL